MGWRVALLLLSFLIAGSPALQAQEPRHEPPAQSQSSPAASQPHRTLLPPDSVTQHKIALGGHDLAYTATAGTIALKSSQGETRAEIFYTSFTVAQNGGGAHRPVTYLFNGGPGAASAYLDIGAVGPRALAMGTNGAVPAAGAGVVDNPDTWLPFTDLVFIDPVGTGWSRATDEDKTAKEFWGVSQDLDAMAEVIRLHLAKTGRSGAPIYLAGESYGGFRAARLARDLATDQGIAVAGIVMVSPVIEFGLMYGGALDPLPAALRLPSFAAAHMGAAALDPGALAPIEQFALNDYLVALAAGPRGGDAQDAVYRKVAELTGLDEAHIARWRGRIPLEAYLRAARSRDGRIISRYDAGVSSVDPNPGSDEGHDDPVLDATIAPFTGAFVSYARDELGFKTDQPFELLSRDVSRRWDWGGGRGAVRSLGASDALRRALALDPRLKVMIAHGVADLQTPYMMSRYVKEQMPDGLGERVVLKLYAGGHMLYLHEPSRHRLRDDAATFYGAAEN
jgi:carboxypeptidase C (cathepsin A)